MLNLLTGRRRLYVLAFFISVSCAGVTTSLWHREKAKAAEALTQLAGVRAKLTQQQQQLQRIAALDEQHTRRLQNAQNTIADLRRRTESGREQLRVAADCSRGLLAPAGRAGVDDADAPVLARHAEQDYFTLLSDIARAEQMILGLQQYVKEQCRG